MRIGLFMTLVLAGTGLGRVHGQEGGSFERDLLNAIDRARPSVVAIESTFELSGNPSPLPSSEAVPTEVSEGAPRVRMAFSGVILREDGYIVTVAGAVDGAAKIDVRLSDDRRFVAEAVGSDAATNLGVIRIDAKGLPAVRPADPASIRVGTWVLGVGNPYGLDHSVSQGIVSGVDRMIAGADERTYPGVLQMTAFVNPGDAGGLLCNTRGEMVGLIACTYQRAPSAANFERMFRNLAQHMDLDAAVSRIREMMKKDEKHELTPEEVARVLQQILFTGGVRGTRRAPDAEGLAGGGVGLGAEGINFAQPANVVLHIGGELIRDRKVARGWFGVQAQGIDPALQAQLELPPAIGVVLTQIVEGGPAAKAGFEPWDIVLTFDGKGVGRVLDLYRAVAATPAGREAPVEFLRRGERRTVNVTMEVSK